MKKIRVIITGTLYECNIVINDNGAESFLKNVLDYYKKYCNRDDWMKVKIETI